ncbi:MAG: alpha/beta hydrolase [Arenimonas sp.]|nr:alpha/beta hydrolase [Arenimonas sp.]
MIPFKSASLVRLAAAGVLVAFLGLPAAASAAEAGKAAVVASTVSVEPNFLIGTLLVQRIGERGTPIILVPGLASGAWAWQDVVRGLEDSHVVYVVTLAGFDGRPAVSGDLMKQALLSLKGLIQTQKLDRPVLIGHSLGGVLSLALAQNEPGLVSGVISIDGLPVFPGTESMPAAQRPAMVESIKSGMVGLDHEQFASQQLQYMRGIGVIDPAVAEKLAKLSSRSDPAATADYMAETLMIDLRPNLGKITVPVLLMSPYNESDGAARKLTEAAKTAYYRSLMAGTPKVDVVSISPARHFAMFDQPKLVGEAIASFLKALGRQ